MDLTYETVNKEQNNLEDIRRDYEKCKRLQVDLTYPERTASWEWMNITSGIGQRGKVYSNVYKRVHDGTAKHAFTTWKNGIMGHFFPKQINWFKGGWSDRRLKESKNVIKWLQDNDDHFTSVLNNSGSVGCDNDYYNQKAWFIGDCGAIGDAFMFIEKDKTTGKQFYMTVHPKYCWIRRDFWGRIQNVHYKMSKTLGEMVDEFGMGCLSEAQRASYDTINGREGTCTVIYGCYKNMDYEPDKSGVKNMPWQTVWCNMDGKVKIKQSGSYTINPIPFSMRRPSDWAYGQGVVYSNILECLTTDEIGKTMLMGVQQAVHPSMLVSSSIMNKLNLQPGFMNKVDTKSMAGVKMGDLLARIVDSSGYPFGVEYHQMWMELVNKRFGVPLFIALNASEGSGKTAFEVNQIKAEQSVLLGPVISEISSITDMEFDRIYDLEAASGDAPEPPEEILRSTNGRIDLSYIGPLNQLLKQYYESQSLLTTIGYIQQALTVAPDSAVVFDGDRLMQKIIRSSNASEDILLSDIEIQELKAIAAQMAEDQRQAEIAKTAGQAYGSLSKPIDPNSLLGAA